MKIFSIKDMKAQLHLQPFGDRDVTSAKRGFQITVNEGDNTIRRYPNEFRLLELADFDELTGEIMPHKHPVDHGAAADYIIATPQHPSLFPAKPAEIRAAGVEAAASN